MISSKAKRARMYISYIISKIRRCHPCSFIEFIHIQIKYIIEAQPPMSTPIQKGSLSPLKRQSEIPLDSIIRQVASPSAHRETQHINPNPAVNIQPLASFSAPPPQLYQTAQTAQFVGGTNSRVINSHQINGQLINPQPINPQIIHSQTNAHAMAQVIPADMPKLAPIRRIQYVPYEQRYVEYVQQRIKVPVQRVCTDFYQIQHITEYMPIEKEEVHYELEPQEVVTMRLQYVPVQQKIVHISDRNARILGIKDYQSTDIKQEDIVETSPLYEAITINGRLPEGAAEKNSASTIRKSRTNFVTSEGYDPQANLQQIDNLLSASSVRGSRAKIAG